MPNSTPISMYVKTSRWPLLAPASFRQTALYCAKGTKPGLRKRSLPLMVAESFLQRMTQPTNILFRYLYRDASNYKQHGEAVFTNNTFLAAAEIEKQIRACLKDGEFFIARQAHIEERFFEALREDDHPWHTFERIEVTTQFPFDPDNWAEKQHRRDIIEFITDLERAHRAGWDEMNVRPDLRRQLENQKAKIRQTLEK
jgi:hypothetical protein